MAERKPVVLVGGQLKELPAGDTLPPQTPATHSHATSDVTGLDAALAGKEPAISAGTTAQYLRGDKTWQTLNKSAVGLGNVDNTSDANKPVSTAQQAALNLKANLASPSFTGIVFAESSPASVGISALTGGNSGFESKAQGSGVTAGAATMTFHRPDAYAVHFGLDTDNKLKVGGWSLGANAYAIYHENNKPTKADVGLGSVDNTSDASKPISTATQSALNAKAPLLQPTLTGLREVRVTMAANNIDMSAGNLFTKTISGATSLTVSNVPASGTLASFILDLTNGGSATITWWSGVKWAGGTAPTLTAAGRDVLGFYTHDGGTTWTGLLLGKDAK